MGALQGRICAISEECPLTGALFAVQGGSIQRMIGWELTEAATTDGDWTIEGIAAQLGAAAV